MNFKNIYVFVFTKPFTTTQEELNNALSDHTFTPCASTELSHYGWTNALGESLTHESDGNILICARKEEKILPAPVVKTETIASINIFEKLNGSKANKKEREQIKEDVIFELLPRAFSRITDTHAYINASENIIVINSASRGKAEDLLALLRKSLGRLPVTSVIPDFHVNDTMTHWVEYEGTHTNKMNSIDFSLGNEAHFNSIGDNSATAIVKQQELDSAEVLIHINIGQYVTKLELGYQDSISFMLHDDLSIKRIKFSDVIMEQNDDIDSDKLARLDADFTLMAGELNRMINALHAEFSVKATDYLEG